MKLRFERIEPPPGGSISSRRSAVDRFDSPFHYHPEIEITLIESSEGTRLVGDHVGRFEAGDLVVHGSGLPHAYFNDEPPEGLSDRATWARAVVVQFRVDALGDGLWNAPELGGVRKLFERARRGLRFSGELKTGVGRAMIALHEARGLERVEKLIRILRLLSESDEWDILASEGYWLGGGTGNHARIQEVYSLVNEGFRGRMTQESVAAAVGMSPAAFSRHFRGQAGKTFTEFLAEVRLGYACRLLQASEARVLEVCYECGFTNLSNFNRRFRLKMGISPSDYRARYRRLGDGRRAG